MHKQSHPIECSDAKKKLISETRKATSLKRQSQIGYVYELKIDKKRLNMLQKEQIEMLFVEGKRFYIICQEKATIFSRCHELTKNFVNKIVL